MSRAIPTLRLGRDAVVPAPVSGVQLGGNGAGPVSLRLFRLLGTRIAVAGLVEAAQLLAVRVASAGTPVQVVTTRPQLWEPLVRHSRFSGVYSSEEGLLPPAGPSLLVDDRPGQPARAGRERSPWQCVIDVRGQWGSQDVAGFTYGDLAVFGAVPAQALPAVASMYAIAPHDVDRLAQIPPGSVAVLRRGHVLLATLDPTQAEFQLIELARSTPPGPAAPVWRG